MKRCNGCGEVLPITAFPAQSAKCRACKKAYMKQWRQQQTAHIKTYSENYRQEHRDAIKTQRDRYQRERGTELNKMWARRNQGRRNALARRRERANPLMHREQRQQRRRANLFRYRLYVRQNQARRKAVAAGVEVKPVSYIAILNRDGYICHICKQAVLPAEVSFDHVVPLSKGGSHSDDNIRIAHLNCNIRKGSKVWTQPLSQAASSQSR